MSSRNLPNCAEGKMRNPMTNRCIKIGGLTHKKLNNSYQQQQQNEYYTNIQATPRTAFNNVQYGKKTSSMIVRQNKQHVNVKPIISVVGNNSEWDFKGVLPSPDIWSDAIQTISKEDVTVMHNNELFTIPAGSTIYLTESDHYVIMSQPNKKMIRNIPFVEWEEIF